MNFVRTAVLMCALGTTFALAGCQDEKSDTASLASEIAKHDQDAKESAKEGRRVIMQNDYFSQREAAKKDQTK